LHENRPQLLPSDLSQHGNVSRDFHLGKEPQSKDLLGLESRTGNEGA
jgi:hypothetical protein